MNKHTRHIDATEEYTYKCQNCGGPKRVYEYEDRLVVYCNCHCVIGGVTIWKEGYEEDESTTE